MSLSRLSRLLVVMLSVVILTVVMLSVIMLTVVVLSVIMMNVVAPLVSQFYKYFFSLLLKVEQNKLERCSGKFFESRVKLIGEL